MFAPQSGDVHAGLALERKDSVDSRPFEPADRAGDVTVRVEKNLDVVFPENRDDFAVVRQQEFIEKLFGDHRAVVVAHILRKAHEFGFIAVEDAVEHLQIEFELVLVQALHELRLVVEGVKMVFDAEEIAREPEKAVEGEPEDRVAALVLFAVAFERLEIDCVEIVNGARGAELLVFREVAYKRAAVRNLRRPGVGRADPALHHEVEPEMLLESDRVETGREPLFPPVFESQMPPRSPFDDGEAVGLLEIQDRLETLSCVHVSVFN